MASSCTPARRTGAEGLRLMQAGTDAGLHQSDLRHAPAAPMPAHLCLDVNDIARRRSTGLKHGLLIYMCLLKPITCRSATDRLIARSKIAHDASYYCMR